MHDPDWVVIPFDMKRDNKGCESDVKDEIIEMHMNFEREALFKSKNLSKYLSNINTTTK